MLSVSDLSLGSQLCDSDISVMRVTAVLHTPGKGVEWLLYCDTSQLSHSLAVGRPAPPRPGNILLSNTRPPPATRHPTPRATPAFSSLPLHTTDSLPQWRRRQSNYDRTSFCWLSCRDTEFRCCAGSSCAPV